MASWQRTHTCGELREAHIGQTVVLNGWVNTYRAYNDQVFVDLRDRYGLTQVVFEADHAELFAAGQEIRSEWVLSVTGQGRASGCRASTTPSWRPATSRCMAEELHGPQPLPDAAVRGDVDAAGGGKFGDPELANEDLRLQYRYLDLRRPTLQRTLAMRHRLNKVIRDYLDAQGFLELETPLLGRSTPEGARDYLVPSRVFTGRVVRAAAVAAALQAAADGRRATTSTSRSPAACATRTCVPTASRSSRSSTWRCRSSRWTTSSASSRG